MALHVYLRIDRAGVLCGFVSNLEELGMDRFADLRAALDAGATPGPWSVAGETFDNDGIQESVIRGLNGRAAIAVALDFGANNPCMRDANAAHISAANQIGRASCRERVCQYV